MIQNNLPFNMFRNSSSLKRFLVQIPFIVQLIVYHLENIFFKTLKVLSSGRRSLQKLNPSKQDCLSLQLLDSAGLLRLSLSFVDNS